MTATFREPAVEGMEGAVYELDGSHVAKFWFAGSADALSRTADFYAALARSSARTGAIAALEMPAKVIWGTADRYLTTALGEERAARFKRGSFHPVEAGHWLQSDEPEIVAKEILS